MEGNFLTRQNNSYLQKCLTLTEAANHAYMTACQTGPDGKFMNLTFSVVIFIGMTPPKHSCYKYIYVTSYVVTIKSMIPAFISADGIISSDNGSCSSLLIMALVSGFRRLFLL